jgi:hypothetical protein
MMVFAGLQSSLRSRSVIPGLYGSMELLLFIALYPSCGCRCIITFFGTMIFVAGVLARHSGIALHGVWLESGRLCDWTAKLQYF